MKENYINRYNLFNEMEKLFEWQKWMREIPYIPFPSNWLVKITPPFGGALIRFRVKVANKDHDISIYLDCYDILGWYGSPYWEVYPYSGDVFRCKMEDTDSLIKAISESLEEEEGERNGN